jgi:hypothetical protein
MTATSSGMQPVDQRTRSKENFNETLRLLFSLDDLRFRIINQQTLSPHAVAHGLILRYFPLADFVLFPENSVFIDVQTLFTQRHADRPFSIGAAAPICAFHHQVLSRDRHLHRFHVRDGFLAHVYLSAVHLFFANA